MLLWGWLYVKNGVQTITDKLPGAPKLEDPTKELVNEINKRKSIMAKFNTEHFYIEMLLRNFSDLKNVLADVNAIQDVASRPDSSHIPYTRNVNRLFINALGSIYTYIEHYEKHVKSWLNHDDVNRITSKYYDNYNLYRVLYKLRNFSTHYLYPITELTSTRDNPNYRYSINTEYLLKSGFSWGKDVSTDLSRLPPALDVLSMVDEAMIMYTRLHIELVQEKIEEVREVQKFYDQFAFIENDIYQYPVLLNFDKDSNHCNVQILFDQDIEQVEDALGILGINIRETNKE